MNIRILRDKKWGYVNTASGKVIDCQYLVAYNFDGDYAIVCDENRKYGVINGEGETVIPFSYDKIINVSDRVFRVYVNESSCLINTDCLLLDDNNIVLPDFVQKYALAIKLDDDSFIVANDGLIGLLRDGKERIPCKYYSISLYDESHLQVKKGPHFTGLLTLSGDIIVPVEYLEVGRMSNNLFYGRRIGWDFYTFDGRLSCHINYRVKIEKFKNDVFILDFGENKFMANLFEGSICLSKNYSENLISIEYDSYGPFINDLCQVNKDHAIGFIDIDGNTIIPCEYDSIEFKGAFAYLTRLKSGGNDSHSKVSEISLFSVDENRIITNRSYSFVSEFEHGYAIVVVSNGLSRHYGVINHKGTETIPAIFSALSKTDNPFIVNVNKAPLFYRLSGEPVFRDTKGQYHPVPDGIEMCGQFSDGLMIIKDTSSSKYGYMNEDGVITIPCKFMPGRIEVSNFERGIAKLTLLSTQSFNSTSLEVYSYINKDGSFIVDYLSKPIIIDGKDIVFVYPFEGNVARAMDVSGYWGLVSPQGESVSPFEYSQILPFYDHESIVFKEGKAGVIRQDGTVLIPVKFSGLRREGEAYISNEGHFDKSGFFTTNGLRLNSSLYDECIPLYENRVRIKYNGKYGLLMADGSIFIPCDYTDIENLDKDCYLCKNEENTVLIFSSDEEILLPHKTKKASIYPNGLIYIENEEGEGSIITKGGRVLMSNIDFQVIGIKYNLIIYQRKRRSIPRSMGVIDIIGNEVLPAEFSLIRFDDIPSSFVARTKEGIEQRYDSQGRKVAALGETLVLLDTKYSASGDYHDGLACVARCVNQENMSEMTWGFLNTVGEESIPCQFKTVTDFSCGLARVSDRSGRYGYINNEGAVQIPCQFTSASSFYDNYASVSAKDITGIINTLGEYILCIKGAAAWHASIDVFREGLAVVRNGDHAGFMNKDGEVEIPSVFRSANPFKNGVATVTFYKRCSPGNNNPKEFRIDKKGRIVIDNDGEKYTINIDLKTFSDLVCIHDGKALIETNESDRMNLISLDGDLILSGNISLSVDGKWYIVFENKYDSAHKIKKKLYILNEGNDLLDENGYLMRLNPEYRIRNYLVDNRYEVVYEGDDVRSNCGIGVIDETGRIIIPCVYDRIKLFRDNKHFICIKDRFDDDGFPHVYNLSGEQVIFDGDTEYCLLSEYESYGDFLSNGLAPVMREGLWGFVDTSLREVIDCKYYKYNWIDDEHCVVDCTGEDEYKRALINKEGEYILAPDRYVYIGEFRNGFACIAMYYFYHMVEKEDYDNKYGEKKITQERVYNERLIDKHGRLVVNDQGTYLFLDKLYKWYIKNPTGSISVFDGIHWGLLDSNLNELIPCLYETAFSFNGSIAVVKKGEKTCIIDRTGRTIIDDCVNRVEVFPNYGIIYVFGNNNVSIYNAEGILMTVIDNCKDAAPLSGRYSKFRRVEERRVVKGRRDEYVNRVLCGFVCHETGEECLGYSSIGSESEGLISVCSLYGWRNNWGYVNAKGESVIPCIYTDSLDFMNGLAIVSKEEEESEPISLSINHKPQKKWGAISKDGSVVIPLVYNILEYDENSSHNMLKADYGGIKTLLDIHGNALSRTEDNSVLHISGFYACNEFVVDGRLVVYGEQGVGVVDEKGSILVKCRDFGKMISGPILKNNGEMEVQMKMNDVLDTMVMNETGCLITNRLGNTITLPFKYLFARDWVGSYIPVYCGGAWGVIDERFIEIIPCKYQEVYIINDRVLVKSNELYSIIDLSNSQVVELNYDFVKPLINGYLRVYINNGQYQPFKTGIIDLNGHVVLNPEYDVVSTADPDLEGDLRYEENDVYESTASAYDDSEDYDLIEDALEGDPDAYWNID